MTEVEDWVESGKEEGERRKWWVWERMVSREVWNCRYSEGGRLEGVMLPAPPWIMIRGVMPLEGWIYSILRVDSVPGSCMFVKNMISGLKEVGCSR